MNVLGSPVGFDSDTSMWFVNLACINSTPNIRMSCASFLNIQDIILQSDGLLETNDQLVPIKTCSSGGKSIVDGSTVPTGANGVDLAFGASCIPSSIRVTEGPDFTWTITGNCSNRDPSTSTTSSVTFSCHDFLTQISDITDVDGTLTIVRK